MPILPQAKIPILYRYLFRKEAFMDLRIEKTRQSITNTFIELRSKKPLEKITVKELCERARINKSTFYSHYADIYALSDALETEVVHSVIAAISHPESVFTDPKSFTRQLFWGYLSQDSLIKILFSGDRYGLLITKIESALKETILNAYPQYQKNPIANIILSYGIHGGYYAFAENRQYGEEKVIEAIGQITESTCHMLEKTDFFG